MAGVHTHHTHTMQIYAHEHTNEQMNETMWKSQAHACNQQENFESAVTQPTCCNPEFEKRKKRSNYMDGQSQTMCTGKNFFHSLIVSYMQCVLFIHSPFPLP